MGTTAYKNGTLHKINKDEQAIPRVPSTPINPFYSNPDLMMEYPNQQVTRFMQECINKQADPRADKQPVPRVDEQPVPRVIEPPVPRVNIKVTQQEHPKATARSYTEATRAPSALRKQKHSELIPQEGPGSHT